MENYSFANNRLAGIVFRAAIFVIGLVSIPVAVVWFPVFGLFFSALLLWLALSPNLFTAGQGTVRVLVGSRTRDYLQENRLVPITILSASQPGVVDGSTTAVIPDSVRLEHNDAKPVYGPDTQEMPAAYGSGINRGSISDMVFYFSEDAVKETDGQDVCITAKTADGNPVRGCSRLEETA